MRSWWISVFCGATQFCNPAPAPYQGSPLDEAICAGNTEKVRGLLASQRMTDGDLHGFAATAIVCKQAQMAALIPDGKRIFADIELLYACGHEQPYERAARALSDGADPNYPGEAGGNVFFKKHCYRDEKLLRLAVRRGLKIDHRNSANKSLLHLAAEDADLTAVKAILRNGARMDKSVVVHSFKEREVESTETETKYVPGNRNYKVTRKGRHVIRDKHEIPLAEYAKDRDGELYRMLSRR